MYLIFQQYEFSFQCIYILIKFVNQLMWTLQFSNKITHTGCYFCEKCNSSFEIHSIYSYLSKIVYFNLLLFHFALGKIKKLT